MAPTKLIEDLNIARLKSGQIHKLSLNVKQNALGVPWKIPIMVAKGNEKGPVLGITAAVHGNELNGLPTIFKLFRNLDVQQLQGTLVAIPVVNVPGFLAKQREFSDGKDLNRIMPGRKEGTSSEMYAYEFTHKLIKKFNYLLDLHTASFGRINSLYIRADLEHPVCGAMAMLQNPHIIVNKYDEEGTLRGWANENGIHTITIEIGNPHRFQRDLIDDTYDGIINLMRYLKMLPGEVKEYHEEVTVCNRSSWIYAYQGGLIEVLPELTKVVEKGEIVARIYSVYGEVLQEIASPRKGIVIGKNVNPVCEAGTRIIHLGNIDDDLKESIADDHL